MRIPAATDRLELARFHDFLREAFPLVHRRLECRQIGESALLYRWPGSQPSLKPLILLAHQDVVAVDEATLHQWTHPPFSGKIADGFVWGRGARDFKPGLMAILESAEWLLQQGFVPERSLYLAFGDDEEVQGYGGAGSDRRAPGRRGRAGRARPGRGRRRRARDGGWCRPPTAGGDDRRGREGLPQPGPRRGGSRWPLRVEPPGEPHPGPCGRPPEARGEALPGGPPGARAIHACRPRRGHGVREDGSSSRTSG